MADEPGGVELAETPEHRKVRKNPWSSQIAKAEAALRENAVLIESAAPSGVASDETLKTRAYENIPPVRSKQPLGKR